MPPYVYLQYMKAVSHNVRLLRSCYWAKTVLFVAGKAVYRIVNGKKDDLSKKLRDRSFF